MPEVPEPPGFAPRPGTWPVAAGTAELMADADRPGAYLLVVAGVAQSYVDLIEPTRIEFGYVRLLADLVELTSELPPAPVDVVHVGGGAATLARAIAARRPGSRQTVVEFDGLLADGVRNRLGATGFELVVDDGRAHLGRRRSGTADVVVTDAFVGNRVPEHLTTAEYLEQVRRVLRPAGWYAVNVADASPLDYARRVTATVADAFRVAIVLAEPAVLRGRRFGNLLVVGSDAELPLAELTRAAAADATDPARLVAGDDLADLLADARPLADADPLPSPEPPPGVFSVG